MKKQRTFQQWTLLLMALTFIITFVFAFYLGKVQEYNRIQQRANMMLEDHPAEYRYTVELILFNQYNAD